MLQLEATDARTLATVLLLTPSFCTHSAGGFDLFADTLNEALVELGLEEQLQVGGAGVGGAGVGGAGVGGAWVGGAGVGGAGVGGAGRWDEEAGRPTTAQPLSAAQPSVDCLASTDKKRPPPPHPYRSDARGRP